MDFPSGTVSSVIVSEKVRDWVSFPESSPVPVFVEIDIVEKVLGLIQESRGKTILLLLFITIEDTTRVANFLSSFASKALLYTFVVISQRGDSSLRLPSISAFRTSRISKPEFNFLMDQAFHGLLENSKSAIREDAETVSVMDSKKDQEALINIGRSLSIEKDPDKLLRTILYLSKKITGADAGSIFLVIPGRAGEKLLKFAYSHTFSKTLKYEAFTMPLNTTSIAGYVAVTGKLLNIPDVYKLTKDDPISFNPTFDKNFGYRTKSMIVVPMRNHLDEIIGVIQLINSKECKDKAGEYTGNEAYEIHLETPEDFEEKVIPFDPRYESLMEAVAGQAAVAIENNRMIKQIETQFEEFVKASVTAIESRDPATSGHSFRVADMSVKIAKAISAAEEGVFADVVFSNIQLKELEFAALLHDFGKVYIDPSVFMKGKKLFPKDFENTMLRLKFLYRTIELKYAALVSNLRIEGDGKALDDALRERDERLLLLRNIMDKIRVLNEPTVQAVAPEEEIRSILASASLLEGSDLQGTPIPLLTEHEIVNFNIRRGTLNDAERAEIQSHVVHTYTFVSKIPWPDEYKNIPDIAKKHHEMLDGSGYPDGLCGKEAIPLQARIMAVADVYDALAAKDRPYKSAVPTEKVLAILKEEAERSKLDRDIVELFMKERLYESG